jgi:hypothetical protein
VSVHIKVKNTTTQPITIGAEDPIAAGKGAELSLDAVRSAELAEHLANGSLVLPRAALDAITGQIIAELEAARAELGTAFAKPDPNKDIGTPITWGP